MSRLERFRQARSLKHKYFLSAVIFLFLLAAGLYTADYSVNSLMEGEKGIGAFAVEKNSRYIEITFMNQKLYINTQYINRDFERLKQQIGQLFGAGDLKSP